MKKSASTFISNIFWRSTTLIGKFTFLLFLGREYDVDFVGQYGLLYSFITIYVFIVGFEFATYNSRRILTNKSTKKIESNIADQIQLIPYLYLVFIPIFITIYLFGAISYVALILMILLVITEHISQELMRLFISLKASTLSYIIGFIRSSSWCYIILLLYYVFGIKYNLEQIVLIWSLFSIGGIFYSIYILNNVLGITLKIKLRSFKVNLFFIKKSLPFFFSGVVLKISELGDRFIIDSILGKSMVGVYFFYVTIASSVYLFVITGIGVILGPKAISYFRQDYLSLYKKTLSSMYRYQFIAYAILSFILYISFDYILLLMGKDLYVEYAGLMGLLLLSNLWLMFADIANIDYYVRDFDYHYLFIIIFYMLMIVLLNMVFLPIYGIYGAAYSLLISNFSLYIIRVVGLNVFKFQN